MSNNVRPVPPSFGHKALTAFISASLCLSLAPAQAFAVDDSTTDTTATTSEAPAQPAPASTTDTPATPTSELSDKLTEAAAPATAAEAPTSAPAVPSATAAPSVAAPASNTERAANRVTAPAPKSLADVYVDGANGNDDTASGAVDAPFKTFEAALKAMSDGGTVHAKGTFALTETVTIPAKATLDIYGDATFTGAGKNGFILSKDATLKASNGAKLSMSGFSTALIAQAGSLITDGIYNFENNASASNGTTGISLNGTVRGSAGRDKLVITANDKSETNFYGASAVFENCTVTVTSQNTERISWTLSGSWIDGKLLTLKNANFTVAGINGGFYIKPSFTDSHFTVAVGPQGAQRTGATIQNTGTISNSTVSINGGREAGLSIGITDGPLTITNSTLDFNNGGTGGLNVNTGKVILENSTIKGDGKNSGALYGAQAKGSITFIGNSLVETPATANSHTGASQSGGSHVVLGGSYHVSYVPNYNSSAGGTVPTNGTDNGNEKLMLFTLIDSSVTELNPLNIAGNAYTYPVANASSDGQKHVWVPAEKVTFELNEPGAQDTVSASFTDGTTTGKEVTAMRGYSLANATPAAGTNEVPQNPTAIGYDFVGWFYKVDGAEKPFDATTAKISSATTVYAKWKENANSYGVAYHNNAGGTDVAYIDKGKNADRSAQVLSYETIASANPAFTPKGKTFKGWNTQADGKGQSYAPNQTIAVPAGKGSIDLYAQWEDQMATVRFSANGGTFSEDSVFKKNPDVFEISTDAQGGEVATVKAKAKVLDNTTLDALLKSLNSSVSTRTPGLYSPIDDEAAFSSIATKKYSVLDKLTKKIEFFGIVYGTSYSYWFTDADGAAAAAINNFTEITGDTTYYLKWKADPNIQVISQESTLDGDIYSDGFISSKDAKFVKTDSESFSMSGQIDAKKIQDQMQSIQALYPQIQESDYKNITLDGTTSTFTATVTFPEGVKVPENPTITTRGLGKAFTVASTEVKGQTVSVVFKLVDGINNYQALKDAVDSTGMDDAEQTAQTGEHPISVTVGGLTLDGSKLNNDQKLVTTGTVEGNFSAIASVASGKIKKFDFSWKATQSERGRDKDAKDNTTIQHTIIAVKTVQQTLPADLLINGDSTHEDVYGVLAGQKVDVTGSVNVTSIKNQMVAIEALYPNTPHNEIGVSIKDFGFTAKLTLPEGMTMPTDLTPESLQLKNFGGFKVTKVEVKDNVATVSMAIADNITTYEQLKKLVDATGDANGWMSLTLPNVTVNSDVADNQVLTATAEVSGFFDALATHGSTTKAFSFAWNGEQWADGKDSIASDPKAIQASVQTPTTVISTLPADLLVGDNTEHDEIFTTIAGSKVSYTGALNVDSIKKQMAYIENLYPGVDKSQISVNVAECSFTATLEAPEGVTIPANVVATPENFGDAFEITKVETNGNKVAVTLKLKDGITKYSELQDAVAKAGDANGWMKLTLHDLMVNSDVAPGTKLTMVGTITGSMKATATSPGGHSKAFSFVWNGEQWPEGKDATTDPTDKSISFTLTVKAADNPDNPDNPNNPDNPSNPDNPNQPSKPGTGKTKVTPQNKAQSKKMIPQTGDVATSASTLAGIAAAGIAALGAHFGIRRKNDEE